MIKLQDLTPDIYYKQSRDFQFIGRLYDVVLNYVKTNADMIYSVPSADAAGSKMIDLLALTLGFTAKHDYNVKQLTAICSILPLILKNKGNIQSILLIGQALLNSEGVTEAFGYNIDETNPYLIQIYIPPSLSDINLLKDLLVYVLPAGMMAEVVRASSQSQIATTSVAPTSTVYVYQTHPNESQLWQPGADMGETDKNTSGIITNSTMFLPDRDLVPANSADRPTEATNTESPSENTEPVDEPIEQGD